MPGFSERIEPAGKLYHFAVLKNNHLLAISSPQRTSLNCGFDKYLYDFLLYLKDWHGSWYLFLSWKRSRMPWQKSEFRGRPSPGSPALGGKKIRRKCIAEPRSGPGEFLWRSGENRHAGKRRRGTVTRESAPTQDKDAVELKTSFPSGRIKGNRFRLRKYTPEGDRHQIRDTFCLYFAQSGKKSTGGLKIILFQSNFRWA